MFQLVIASAFQRQLKRLVRQNPQLKNKITQTLKDLSKNIDKSSLKVHKLSGEDDWSVSVTYKIRLIIHLEGNKIFCLRIGSHDEVY